MLGSTARIGSLTWASPAAGSPCCRRPTWRRAASPSRLDGAMISPAFIDPHFHLENALLDDAVNVSGTLREAIDIYAGIKRNMSREDIVARATRALRMAVANGTLWLRNNVDIDQIAQVAAAGCHLRGAREVRRRDRRSDRCFPPTRPGPEPRSGRPDVAGDGARGSGGGRHAARRAGHGRRRTPHRDRLRDRQGARRRHRHARGRDGRPLLAYAGSAGGQDDRRGLSGPGDGRPLLRHGRMGRRPGQPRDREGAAGRGQHLHERAGQPAAAGSRRSPTGASGGSPGCASCSTPVSTSPAGRTT